MLAGKHVLFLGEGSLMLRHRITASAAAAILAALVTQAFAQATPAPTEPAAPAAPTEPAAPAAPAKPPTPAAPAAPAPPSGPAVDLVDKQGEWSLYADNATPKTVCFIAAQPQAVEPLGANRGPIFFYISAWPKDGVKTEPSIKVGYPLAADKEMTVAIGTDTFKLFAKGERGFVSDATEEQKLVETLKKGSTAIVKATSLRGTATTDTYSLSGINKALQKMAETCP